ncbi:hypothetical protein Tsubulata_019292 [Turnera subulata]|uniref:Uncharacterized protein n=1 Tax=Turnera subulata TaxID=218843 RepID=A0A9Q0J1Z1_9ROSI|nr:hypothetical protein Tsubulata_019292 [Turnera subulata]
MLSLHLKLMYPDVVGMPEMSAYAGFYYLCSPKKGSMSLFQQLLALVGSLFGQFAKLLGCHVIGSAGSNSEGESSISFRQEFDNVIGPHPMYKVILLKDQLGLDDAFNYKEEPDLDRALKRFFLLGTLKMLGGKMPDAVLLNMRMLWPGCYMRNDLSVQP